MPQATESSNAEKSEFKTPENSASITNETAKRSCDVLLNNFQIKKKRYRVLLNDDHIVWEPWNTKQNNGYGDEKLNAKKESDVEKHELSNKTVYGSSSNVVHIKEIIRIESRDTQSASLCVETQPAGTLENATSQINSADQAEITPSAQYLTIHYAERMVKSPTDCNRWRTKSLTLYNADPYIIAHWHIVLLKKLNENKNRLHIRRMLVFINPYGGRKEGFQTYEKHCKPIFQLAGIDASCVISQRANQILDIIMSHDLAPYDAICCVGGDGTAAEVINGLIFRAMRDHGLDVRQPAYIPKPTLPIGIIPAGSTDTIAYSAHGTADPRTAAIHVVLGQRRGFDICSVRNNRGIVRFCASVFSYGYLGDVAAHSEKYRWMGPKRYEYTGVKAFLSNRAYEAKIRILETVDDENEVQASTSRSNLATESICYANCQRCSSVLSKHNCKVDGSSVTTSNWTLYTEKILEPVLGSDNIVKNIGPAGDASDVVDITSHKTSNISTENCLTKSTINCDSNLQNCLDDNNLKIKEMIKCDNDVKIDDEETVIKTSLDAAKMSSQNSFLFCSTNSTANNRQVDSNSNSSNKMAITPALPSQISNTASRWKTIRGKFFMITCANITCACSRTPNGISRYNHLGDGHLDVILVRKTSILNNLRFALNTMGRNGDIVWINYKANLKRKLSHNKSNFQATGGGPSTEISISPMEQSVIELVSLDKQATPDGFSVGVRSYPSSSKEFSAQKNSSYVASMGISNTENEYPQCSKKAVGGLKSAKKSVEEERLNILKNQENNQAEILGTLKTIESTLYKRYKLSKSMHHIEIKKAAIEIEYRKSKIELNNTKVK